MKKMILLFILGSFTFSFALDSWGSRKGYTKPYKDFWGNSYKNYNNMWKDSDGDGVSNYYDYNDRDPNITTPYQKGFKSYKKWKW